MKKNERNDFTGRTEGDELAELRKARKQLEAELEKDKKKERVTVSIKREKEKIRELQHQVRQKKKSKTFTRRAMRRLKSIEGGAERAVHPERFSKSGKRKKGRAGKR